MNGCPRRFGISMWLARGRWSRGYSPLAILGLFLVTATVAVLAGSGLGCRSKDGALGARMRIVPAAREITADVGVLEVAIRIEGAGGEARPAAFQFVLTYDPAVLRAERVEEGTYTRDMGLSTFCLAKEINNDKGEITLACASSGAIERPRSSGDIASISFVPVGPGVTELALTEVALATLLGEDIPARVTNASVSVKD